MKKLLLIVAVFAATTGAQAQITFGAQAGANMGNVKDEYTGTPSQKSSYDSKIGLLVGAVAEISFSENVSFRPELNFIQKGYKDNFTETDQGITTTYDGKVTMNFIELPLNFTYSFNAGAGKFFLGAGPTFGFGLSGKAEYTATTPGFPTVEGDVDIKFDGKKDAVDNDEHLKAFDFGANVMAGYKMPMGLFFTLGYTQGFGNLSPYDNSKTTTSGIALKIGYMFGGIKTAE